MKAQTVITHAPNRVAPGVSLRKAGDPVAPVRPVEQESAEIMLKSVNVEGGWITYEPRATVEGWRRDCLRVGGYEMAAAWGVVLRGEA